MYQSITLTTADLLQSFINQVDQKLVIFGSGSPIDVIAVARSGVFYWDFTNKNLYFCTETDTTILGTTWELTSLIASDLFASAGINGDITELTGLTTPLSPAQGGTGIDATAQNQGLILAIDATGTWTASAGFGAGQDGGNITAGSTPLTFGSPTRYTIAGTKAIVLPGYNSDYDGFIFKFKITGSSVLTFTVQGNSVPVEGSTSFVYSTANIDNAGGTNYPCICMQLIDGQWWSV